MLQFRLACCLGIALSLAGCAAFTFTPGVSCKDTTYFQSPPVIVMKGGQYLLRWTQGSYPYYFYPDSKVRDGSLCFAMQVTTSTGNAAGRTIEIPVEGRKAIAALHDEEVYWWEPDGSKVRLQIIRLEHIN